MTPMRTPRRRNASMSVPCAPKPKGRSAITAARIAASPTVRHMGPAVSCRGEMGTTPLPLTTPTVGLSPTRPLIEEGERMDPLVSVPMAAAQKLAPDDTPEPALDPDGFRAGA